MKDKFCKIIIFTPLVLIVSGLIMFVLGLVTFSKTFLILGFLVVFILTVFLIILAKDEKIAISSITALLVLSLVFIYDLLIIIPIKKENNDKNNTPASSVTDLDKKDSKFEESSISEITNSEEDIEGEKVEWEYDEDTKELSVVVKKGISFSTNLTYKEDKYVLSIVTTDKEGKVEEFNIELEEYPNSINVNQR